MEAVMDGTSFKKEWETCKEELEIVDGDGNCEVAFYAGAVTLLKLLASADATLMNFMDAELVGFFRAKIDATNKETLQSAAPILEEISDASSESTGDAGSGETGDPGIQATSQQL